MTYRTEASVLRSRDRLRRAMRLGAWLVMGAILPAGAGCSGDGRGAAVGTRSKSDKRNEQPGADPDAGSGQADAGPGAAGDAGMGAPNACATPYDQICEADEWCWKNPLPQ